MPRHEEHWLLPSEPYASYSDYRDDHDEQAIEIARGMGPTEVLWRIEKAGLRGRGGAGFPTGTKWGTLARHSCKTRHVVCNAAEGEPGTFKDRWLIRQNPYAVLEGMLIAAHVIGAEKLHIGIKSSFKTEIERLQAALEEMAEAKLLAGLDVTLVEGPEEYLFGEERALLEVLEGGEPLPREAHYPPYERGLFATPASPNPALVNNAETYAHVPSIVRAGPDSFRALGTADTPGTLLFTVSGDVQRPGVFECEAGISLRELFYQKAGGPLEGRSFRVALAGVASAAITPERFDTRADFSSLHMIGSGLGSCGFVLYDDANSMPRVAQAVARFLYVESCNQCSACKHGLRTASEAIDELFDPAEASPDDIPRALFGARSAPQGNRCYLPVQGSVVISSLMRAFRDDFDVQLHRPEAPSDKVPIPKIVDFDPEGPTFTYDGDQARKTPDWTYEEPEPPVSLGKPAPRPLDADHAPMVVRLSPDIAVVFEDKALEAGRSIDAVVNEALREWLASQLKGSGR
jgi:NADH:ubiquinone oxidoreductase subunit F (NADH-binding)